MKPFSRWDRLVSTQRPLGEKVARAYSHIIAQSWKPELLYQSVTSHAVNAPFSRSRASISEVDPGNGLLFCL